MDALPSPNQKYYKVKLEVSADQITWREAKVEKIPDSSDTFLAHVEYDNFFRVVVQNKYNSKHSMKSLLFIEQGAAAYIIVFPNTTAILDKYVTTKHNYPLRFTKTAVIADDSEEQADVRDRTTDIGVLQVEICFGKGRKEKIAQPAEDEDDEEDEEDEEDDSLDFNQQQLCDESMTKRYGLSISLGNPNVRKPMSFRYEFTRSTAKKSISFICRDALGYETEKRVRGMSAPQPSQAEPIAIAESPAPCTSLKRSREEKVTPSETAKRQRTEPSSSTTQKEETEPQSEVVQAEKKTAHQGLRAWSAEKVAKWVRSLDAKFEALAYHDKFLTNDVDGVALLALSNDLLKEMQITVAGHRAKILAEIDSLKAYHTDIAAPTHDKSKGTSDVPIIIDE